MNFTQIEKQFKQFILNDPDTATALGDTQFLDQLGDPSLKALASENEQASQILDDIHALSASTDLSFDESLDLELMERHLKIQLFFNQLKQGDELQRCRKPNGVDGISAGIFQLFVNDERTAQCRLDDILNRLKQAPDYLKQELDVIKAPITRWRDIEVEQGEGLPDLFETILNWAKQEGYPHADALEQAIEETNASLNKYLEALKKRSTIDHFAIGEENVNTLLNLRAIDQTPKQLAQMAKQFMLETKNLLDDLTGKLIKKYHLSEGTTQAALHEFLNERFAAKIHNEKLDGILDYYHEQIQSIEDFIANNKLFAIPEDQSMKIMQTPSFLEPVIPAGAMWPPLALRDGIKTSLVYLTLKQDQLAEHTELGIPVMMIHEGIPGHHLQFATAALHDSFIRRIYSANEHAEGWTTMLEDYMLDVGYIKDDLVDEVRFIAKREMSRLVARVGIDLYFMTGNKSYLDVGLDLTFESDDVFENAAKLLKTATGFTDGRVQAELNWYSTEQGYPLSYLTGNRMVWKMKSDIKQANKKQLTNVELDKAFHEIYLTSGCMPVNCLKKVFENEGFL